MTQIMAEHFFFEEKRDQSNMTSIHSFERGTSRSELDIDTFD